MVASGEPTLHEPVLHEPVSPPACPTGDCKSPILGDPQPGKNPAAIRHGGKLLPEPDKQRDRQPKEPVHGRGGFAADRDTQWTPDDKTGSDGTLRYVEVFNPAILPFKRMTVLDAARADYTLYVYDQSQTDLKVGGKRNADRDAFWGSLMVQLSPGEYVPIPSVAADMRILSYEVDPPLRVTFSKDQADNYYVRADDPDADGKYRLVFLVDAPATYFSSAVPGGKTLAEARASGLTRPLMPGVRDAGLQMAGRLGITESTPLDVAVDKLVAWHRAFEAGVLPRGGDDSDIYRDLFLAQTGVCRHRSFTFVITANAVGIPARYVTNEAHAFVEIWVPQVGWRRIDLGGAAMDLEVSNAENKQMHRPRGEDPFPQPPAYQNNYTRMHGVSGLSDQQKDDIRRGGSEEPGQQPGPEPSKLQPEQTAPMPGKNLPPLPDKVYENKKLVLITVDAITESEAWRGVQLRVSGRVATSEGRDPVAAVAVDIYFAPRGSEGNGAVLVGKSMTGSDGTWTALVDIPGDLPLMEYEVYASTPGDAKHAPGLSP
jgi:hypothetical protein